MRYALTGAKQYSWPLSPDVPSPVTEGDRQFSLGHFLVAFAEQAEELCFKGGLQQTVVLKLM